MGCITFTHVTFLSGTKPSATSVDHTQKRASLKVAAPHSLVFYAPVLAKLHH